ncbi:hypothetical protein H4R34_004424 [Dimargaris verticillata]|uniref:Uncharacterized protein n=1 Tax=Dimargaris verticillata TaxID=2761393 RepID=A0A9W8E852_9FUNG|nr:hypothetical protein H4R34_004424 [Dimargaris verticillata]
MVIFYNLRQRLKLPAIRGMPDFVGLHTLLDGAQLDFRKLFYDYCTYFKHSASNGQSWQDRMDLRYPDRFLAYPLRNVAMPPLTTSCRDFPLDMKPITSNKIKHGLVNLGHASPGLKPDIQHIIDVVTAFFEALGSLKLLANFKDIVKQASKDFQDSQFLASTDPPSITPGQLLSKEFRAFVYQFWVEVIGNNNEERLRYFLHNLLAFHVIPSIIGQVLESDKSVEPDEPGRYDDTLELAKQIHEIPGFKLVVKSYAENAPNYFEFIMVSAILKQSAADDYSHRHSESP